jgi:hypothetical protein
MSVVKPPLTFDVPISSPPYHLLDLVLLKARPHIKTSSTAQSDFKTLAAHYGVADRPTVDNKQAYETTVYIATKPASDRGIRCWV